MNPETFKRFCEALFKDYPNERFLFIHLPQGSPVASVKSTMEKPLAIDALEKILRQLKGDA